jgi:hypothetical protein
VGGIFVIISNPTNIARTKIVRPMMNISITVTRPYADRAGNPKTSRMRG